MSKIIKFGIIKNSKGGKKMKKLSFQKIFCFLSILFIVSCCVFYGTRLIKLYLENKKVEIKEKNSLVKALKENNSENEYFKSVNGINYFTGKTDTNYLLYHQILWRIIKVNDDNSLTAISNNALTYLAFSKTDEYANSPIYNWLNTTDEEYSGILEKALNKDYLQKTTACTTKLDELSNTPCKDMNDDNYLSLLSIVDYLNIGSKDSYLVNGENFYLSNLNTENKTWYIDEEGNGKLGTGNDILGIRPVITIKANVDYIDGDGTIEKPYTIEKEKNLFGSYVKLGNDIWRIYQVNESDVRLMLNDYLKVNGNPLTYKYSNNSSYHNDTASGSIAYYLNKNYLSTLSYKDKIKETKWSNGYYNSTTNYDYKNALKDQIDTKVALMSIGDIYLNPELHSFFTMTGNNSKGSMVYTITKDKKLYAKQVGSSANIVPTISLDKSLLTKGNGTKNSPLEME